MTMRNPTSWPAALALSIALLFPPSFASVVAQTLGPQPPAAAAAIASSGSASDLVAGTIPADRMPAHTGDCTTSAGAVAVTCAVSRTSGITVDTSFSYQTPTTGFSITLGGAATTTILDPAGTLASGTIIMPAAPVDGQIVKIASTQIITSLTMTPNAGQSIKGALTTFAVGARAECIYRASGTTWFC